MTPLRTTQNQTLSIAGLWLAAVLFASQPLASAFGITALDLLRPVLDQPAHRSFIYLGATLALLLLFAGFIYFRGISPLVQSRSKGRVVAVALAPSAFGAAWLAAFDVGAGGPSIWTFAGVPVLLVVPTLLLLLAESVVGGLAHRLALAGSTRDWRGLGIRAASLALGLRPADHQLREELGLMLAGEDRYAEAIVHLEALEPAADDQRMQERLGALERCYRGLDQREQAVACLEELLQRNPRARGIANRLLDDYLALDRPREAVALLEQHQLKDTFTRLKLRQSLYSRLGDYEKSFELIRRITAAENEHHDVSIQLTRELLQVAPNMQEARIHLAALLIEDSQTHLRAEGAALIEKLLVDLPDRQDLRERLVAHYRETQQNERALPHLLRLASDQTMDADVYLDAAAILQRLDRVDEAVAVLKTMTQVMPRDWQAYVRLARLLILRNELDEAEEALARAGEFAGQEGAASVEHLRKDLEAQRAEERIRLMREALEQGGGDIETRLRLIEELIVSDRIDEALHTSELMLHEQPESLEPLLHTLEEATRRPDVSFRLYDYLADLYFQQGRYDELLRLYRAMAEKSLEPARMIERGCLRILDRAPNHVETRRELALARRSRSDWAGVIEAIDPMLAAEADGGTPLAPEDRALWVEASWRLGQAAEAAQEGWKIVDDLSGEAGFMLMMIEILQSMKDHTGAYRVYEKAAVRLPGDERLHRLARRIDFDRKQQRLAELSARGLDGLTPAEHFEKAELHREFQEFESAIIHYQRAAHDDALALPAYGNMAVVMCERGMYDLAAETIEPIELTREIDQRHPDLKEMFYAVATAMEKQKRFADALTIYKRIFRVDAAFRDVVDRLQRLG